MPMDKDCRASYWTRKLDLQQVSDRCSPSLAAIESENSLNVVSFKTQRYGKRSGTMTGESYYVWKKEDTSGEFEKCG